MTGDEKVKKSRDPIFTACLVIFLVAMVGIIGVYVNDHFLKEDNTEAEIGDKVSVEYTGSYYSFVGDDKAVVFDTSYKSIADDDEIIKANEFTKRSSYSPLSFTIGGKKMLEGFENAVVGHRVGDTFTVMIPAGEGYLGTDSITESVNGQKVGVDTTMPYETFKQTYKNVKVTSDKESVAFTTVYGWKATAKLVSSSNMVIIHADPKVGETYKYVPQTDKDKDEDAPAADRFGTVSYKVTSVDRTDITYDIVFENTVKTGGDNGEIQMLKMNHGGKTVYVTNIGDHTFTYKVDSEKANIVLYFEIKLVKIE